MVAGRGVAQLIGGRRSEDSTSRIQRLSALGNGYFLYLPLGVVARCGRLCGPSRSSYTAHRHWALPSNAVGDAVESASHYVGLRVKTITIWLPTSICGLCAGIAGFIAASSHQQRRRPAEHRHRTRRWNLKRSSPSSSAAPPSPAVASRSPELDPRRAAACRRIRNDAACRRR